MVSHELKCHQVEINIEMIKAFRGASKLQNFTGKQETTRESTRN